MTEHDISPCNIDRNRIYQEAGAMMRHYSITRTSILSVAFTLAFGIAAYSFTFTWQPPIPTTAGGGTSQAEHNQNVILLLILREVLLMIIALIAAAKLSSVMKVLRNRLMAFEGGESLLVHRAINDIWNSGKVFFDDLDILCVVIVMLFNLGLILAHFYILR